MEVRSYYATTVEAAISLARQELGSEAMLIQCNPTAPELAHLGRYEVVFAGELQEPKISRAIRSREETPQRISPSIGFPLPAMHFPMRPPSVVKGSPLTPDESATLRPVDLVPPLNGNFSALLAAAVESADATDSFDDEKAPPYPLQAANSAKTKAPDFACSPGVGKPGSQDRVAAFVGPTGAGKTTTIMKLAISQGILLDRAVRILVIDPDRVGATSQLERFAEVLGIPFQELETPGMLSAELSRPAAGLTLVDTPGWGRHAATEASMLARSLRASAAIETQLVLRADRKTADNLSSIEFFRAFRPARLILTGLDETASLDELPDLIERARIPVSFLSFGQRIPEDFEEASSARISELISKGRPQDSRFAAA